MNSDEIANCINDSERKQENDEFSDFSDSDLEGNIFENTVKNDIDNIDTESDPDLKIVAKNLEASEDLAEISKNMKNFMKNGNKNILDNSANHNGNNINKNYNNGSSNGDNSTFINKKRKHD